MKEKYVTRSLGRTYMELEGMEIVQANEKAYKEVCDAIMKSGYKSLPKDFRKVHGNILSTVNKKGGLEALSQFSANISYYQGLPPLKVNYNGQSMPIVFALMEQINSAIQRKEGLLGICIQTDEELPMEQLVNIEAQEIKKVLSSHKGRGFSFV